MSNLEQIFIDFNKSMFNLYVTKMILKSSVYSGEKRFRAPEVDSLVSQLLDENVMRCITIEDELEQRRELRMLV